jgi:O-6-methylguanine DNA methyltransferase
MNSTWFGEPSPLRILAAERPLQRRLRERMTQGLLAETEAGWVGIALDPAHRLTEIVMPRETAEHAADALGVTDLRPLSRPHPAQPLVDQLRRYFAGEPVAFDWPLDLSHFTPFQREALTHCASIPYGELRSYGWIADRMGRPKSARPVGQAMSMNPIPILIPCHRVVGSNGQIVSYGGGIYWKERLLELEGVREWGKWE